MIPDRDGAARPIEQPEEWDEEDREEDTEVIEDDE